VRDSKIGDSVYIGYNTEINNSQVGNRALIYHGARAEGVEIPEGTLIPAGAVVTSEDDVQALKEG
jgi:carbon dioxide concentrating mechanism protein CcmM